MRETPPRTKRRIEKSRAKQKGDMLMDWIKVTPETMPPDMEPVMVTVKGKLGSDIMKDVVWEQKSNGWAYDDGADCLIYLDENLKVTHWMPYPEPAED